MTPGLARPVVVGVVVGLLVLFVEGTLGWLLVTAETARVRHGWDVVPTVVLTRDAGQEALTTELLAVRDGLAHHTAAGTVPPMDLPSVINERLIISASAGDPLRRSDVEGRPELVLFATRQLESGTIIAVGDFEARPFRSDWLTPSWVRAREADALVGRIVRAPLRAGDPALWNQLAPAAP